MIWFFSADVTFRDRSHAGSVLAEELAKRSKGGTSVLVVGIPRGGVILADIVAAKLGADFDIVIPRKLGAPENEELAIGAVTEDGTAYINTYLVRALRIPQDYIDKEKSRQIGEIRRRSSAYRSPDAPYKIAGKTTFLVDDGIATGATIIASARWLRKQNPESLTIAVPVAPTQSIELLEDEADSIVTVHQSRDFGAVGQFYDTFEPVSDEQVQAIMRARKLL